MVLVTLGAFTNKFQHVGGNCLSHKCHSCAVCKYGRYCLSVFKASAHASMVGLLQLWEESVFFRQSFDQHNSHLIKPVTVCSCALFTYSLKSESSAGLGKWSNTAAHCWETELIFHLIIKSKSQKIKAAMPSFHCPDCGTEIQGTNCAHELSRQMVKISFQGKWYKNCIPHFGAILPNVQCTHATNCHV